MKSAASCGNIIVAVIVAAAVFGLGPRRAEAQFGTGTGCDGYGFGFGGFSQVPKPESFLYQNALVAAGRDNHIPSRGLYANNLNSYFNHIRDNGFVERHPGARRDDPARSGYGPPRPSPATTRTATNVRPQMPVLPLSSFYDQKNQLVWPGDAPTAGELKEKRTIFDRASEVVLAETKKNGVASMATVTDAQQKLLDYGRPGLQYVRAHETPGVPDTYHMFLLSLYESLSHAVNPPAPAAAPTPPPPRVVPGGTRHARLDQGLSARAAAESRFFRER
ncbi:MAG: hypothetical protein ACHRXM_30775 [Isosphaerales bacterium]